MPSFLAQCLFGDSLFSHGRIDSEFGGDQRGYGDEDLALGGGAGGGDDLVFIEIKTKSDTEAILGHFDSFIPGVSPGIGPIHIREIHHIAFPSSLP